MCRTYGNEQHLGSTRENWFDLSLVFQLNHLTLESPFFLDLFAQGFTKIFESEQTERTLASISWCRTLRKIFAKCRRQDILQGEMYSKRGSEDLLLFSPIGKLPFYLIWAYKLFQALNWLNFFRLQLAIGDRIFYLRCFCRHGGNFWCRAQKEWTVLQKVRYKYRNLKERTRLMNVLLNFLSGDYALFLKVLRQRIRVSQSCSTMFDKNKRRITYCRTWEARDISNVPENQTHALHRIRIVEFQNMWKL